MVKKQWRPWFRELHRANTHLSLKTSSPVTCRRLRPACSTNFSRIAGPDVEILGFIGTCSPDHRRTDVDGCPPFDDARFAHHRLLLDPCRDHQFAMAPAPPPRD